ncbi:glycosyltransferase [Patescibacteria group bacterium]
MQKKTLSVAVPVYNEEVDLPKNIPILFSFMQKNMSDYDWEIVIVDNASTDKTSTIAKGLAKTDKINYLRLDKKGRGRALKAAWTSSKSVLLSYMDIDLSSDLTYFPMLVKALEEGSDIAIGSRLAKGSKVYGRTLTREIMSRGYSFLFRSLFWTSFKDAQCGFKALKKSCWEKVSPTIVDNEWFFDSELLIIAQKCDLHIKEVPITWKDDPNSTVKVAKTAIGDIKGLIRLFLKRPWKKLKS